MGKSLTELIEQGNTMIMKYVKNIEQRIYDVNNSCGAIFWLVEDLELSFSI